MSLRSSAAAFKKQVDGRDWKRFDVMRFAQDGVCFRGKLIGVLEVSEARGEKMCQEAMADLKMAIKAACEHKRKIIIGIALDGLRLRDENSRDCLYHHPVHKISFIAQDATDNRAFGYVFGSPNLGHRFFGIKTEKNAQVVVQTIRDLFEVVYSMKKKEFDKGEILGGLVESKAERNDTKRRESEDSSEKGISADLLSINLSSNISTPRSAPFKTTKAPAVSKNFQDPFGDSFDFSTLSHDQAASASLSWKKPPKPAPSADLFLATLPPPPRRGANKPTANSCASSVKTVSRESSFKSSGSGASSSAFNDMFPKWPASDQFNSTNPANFGTAPTNGSVDRYAVFAELEKDIIPNEQPSTIQSKFEAENSPARKNDPVQNGKLPIVPPPKPSPTQKEFSAIARLRRPQPEGFSLANSVDQQSSFFSSFSGPSSLDKPEEVQPDIFQARWENTPLPPPVKNTREELRKMSTDSEDVFEKLVFKGDEERRQIPSMHQRSFTLAEPTTTPRQLFLGRSEDTFSRNAEHSFEDRFGETQASKPVEEYFDDRFGARYDDFANSTPQHSYDRNLKWSVDDSPKKIEASFEQGGEVTDETAKFPEASFDDGFGEEFGETSKEVRQDRSIGFGEEFDETSKGPMQDLFDDKFGETHLFSASKVEEFEKVVTSSETSEDAATKRDFLSIWPERERTGQADEEKIEEKAEEDQKPIEGKEEETQQDAEGEVEPTKVPEAELIASPIDDQKFYSDHEPTSSMWTDDKFSTAHDVTDTDNEDTLHDVHDDEQDDYLHEEPSCTLDSMNTAAPSLGNLEADFLSAQDALSPEPDITFPSVTSGASLQDVSQIASDCTEKVDEEGQDDSSEASDSVTFQADFPPAKPHLSSSATNEESSTYVSCKESTSGKSEPTIAEKKEEEKVEIKPEEEKRVEEPKEERPKEAVPPWLKETPFPMPTAPPSFPFPTPVPGESAQDFEEKQRKAQEAFWVGYQQWMAAGAFYQQWSWMMQQQGVPLPMAMPVGAPFAMPGAPAMFIPPATVSPCPPPLPPRTHPLQQQQHWKWMKPDAGRPNSALEFSGEQESHVAYERGYMSPAMTSKRSHMSDDRLYESAMWGGRMFPRRNDEEGASPGQQRRHQHQRVVSADRPRGYYTYNPKLGNREAHGHYTSMPDEYYYEEDQKNREEEDDCEEPPPVPARPPSGKRPVVRKESKEPLPGFEDAWRTYPSSSPLVAEETPKKFQKPPSMMKSRSGSVRSRSSTEDAFTPPPKDGFEACFEDAFGATGVQKKQEDPWAAKPTVKKTNVARKESQDGGGKQRLTTSMSVNIFRHEDDPFGDDFFDNPDVVEGAVGGGASFECGSDDEDNWKTPFRSFDFSKFS